MGFGLQALRKTSRPCWRFHPLSVPNGLFNKEIVRLLTLRQHRGRYIGVRLSFYFGVSGASERLQGNEPPPPLSVGDAHFTCQGEALKEPGFPVTAKQRPTGVKSHQTWDWRRERKNSTQKCRSRDQGGTLRSLCSHWFLKRGCSIFF